jgi:hypothetical protein
MIEKIFYNNDELLAIIVRSNYSAEGITFFTPDNFSQQVGYMNRPARYKIKPHFHNKIRREVFNTQEVLLIKRGQIRIDLYNSNLTFCESAILNAGDVILLVSGGHGIEMIKSSEIIEIKQGPYSGDRDKTRFNGRGIDNSSVDGDH